MYYYLPSKIDLNTQIDATVMIPVKPETLSVGDRAILGIRLEHLRLDRNNPIVNGEVVVVERLGKETYLYIEIAGDKTIVVQTDGDNPARIHDYVPIYINGELCHLFD